MRYQGLWRTVLALLGCLLTVLGGAAAAQTFALSPANGIVLVSPAPRSRLVAGQQVTLAWRPGANFSRLAWTDEWEAFLSLDGGRHFSLRITPHLSRGLHAVTWRVPDLPSPDVRLLLRFGDETKELLVPLSARFEIVSSRDRGLLDAGLWQGARLAFAPGEPALPGSGGVVAWSEGGREDGSANWVAAICWQAQMARVRSWLLCDLPPATIRDPTPSLGSPRPPPSGDLVVSSYPNLPRGTIRSVRDLLLLIDRRNE